LREYWNSGKKKIKGFEKDLVRRLVEIVERKEADIRIIKNLDNPTAEQFERQVKLALANNILDEN
jgi:hypothetical protein